MDSRVIVAPTPARTGGHRQEIRQPPLQFLYPIQESNIGLMTAVDKLEYRNDYKFST